jgi:triphosphatase
VESQELEWQFDAGDLRPVRSRLTGSSGTGGEFIVTPAGDVTQDDVYLDTEDQRFARAGYALRIRRDGRRAGAEATLKGIDGADGSEPGLRSRRELSEHLEGTDPLLLASAAGPVGARVRAVAGGRPLRPLFEVHTNRELLTLAAEGVAPGEIALDETTISTVVGRPPEHLRRVEIEIPESSRAVFTRFVAGLRSDCTLRPAVLSKYETGLASAGLTVPSREAFGAVEIHPGLTIGAVALAVLRRHFAALLAKEPGTRLGDDIEELHDMRVASRRLRAALSLFEDVLPASVLELREELAWIGGQLGKVRDLDVQLEQLEAWIAAAAEEDAAALLALRSVLQEQRADARAAMLEALDSPRYDAFERGFGNELRTAQASGGSAPALAVAPALIERRWSAVRKSAKRLGRSSPPQDYHRLRIRCKRLRYALEFLTDVYAGRTRPVLKQLVALQDVLGLHQDAFVAIERLRTLAAERGVELGPDAVFAMGEIAERYRHGVAKLQAEVLPAYRRVAGKRWTSFQKHIDSLQPPEPAEADAPAGG